MFRGWILRIPRTVGTCILLTVSVSTIRVAGQASSAKPSKPPRVLLQVVNRHFTVGKKIPSNYLKVLSDGTVEGQPIDNPEADAVKKVQISPSELARVSSILNDPRLEDLGRSYALHRFVTDSWMEWDITISRSAPPPQNITLSFAGGSGDWRHDRLPDALKKLGCQIIELRQRVYGDEYGYYDPACTTPSLP